MSGLSFHIASLDEGGVLNVWVSGGAPALGVLQPRGQLACGGRGSAGGARLRRGTRRDWTTGARAGPRGGRSRVRAGGRRALEGPADRPRGLAVGLSRDRVRGQAKGVSTFNTLVVKVATVFEHLI